MQTTISDLIGGENRQIISQGNHLPDKEIEDALRLWSLTPIEGKNETGKRVLTRQTMYGAMRSGRTADLFTIRNTIRSVVMPMESMSHEVIKYFTWNYLTGFPHNAIGLKWILKDRAYPRASDRSHRSQHFVGDDAINLLNRGEGIWPVQS